MDEQGVTVVIHQAKVLSYRDVAGLNACWLAVSRKTVITALARRSDFATHTTREAGVKHASRKGNWLGGLDTKIRFSGGQKTAAGPAGYGRR
jgi:hypothetical protein